MQPVITHSITDLKSCEAVLKIMLAKNPNIGMLIVSEQAQRQIAEDVNALAQRYNLSFRNGLSVMGVKLRTRTEQDDIEAAHNAQQARMQMMIHIEEKRRQEEVRHRLEREKRWIVEDQFDASKPLEKWVEYKRALGRIKGPKWRSYDE